jgi:ribonucleoside-diphosphate reductase alpha chain
MKYRFKEADGTPIDGTVEDSWRRIARALAEVEADPAQWESASMRAGGVQVPARRPDHGRGRHRAQVTLFNCFVMGTIPTAWGHLRRLKEAALTMQQGGGIGYDFSTIRPAGRR